MDDLVRWLGQQLDDDERIARAASHWTVVGEPGNWKSAPGGDEWEAARDDCDVDELMVALRPDLPRPPEASTGLWGVIVAHDPALEDSEVASPLPQIQHAARHDPARVLREIDAKRAILALHTQSIRDGGCQVCDVPGGRRLRPDACTTVRMLALPYADRPGYREDWRP